VPILISKRIEDALKAGGFKLKRSKKHRVYENAAGRTMTIASTPSDHRAEENILTEIRRASQPLPEKTEAVDATLPKQRKTKTGMAGGTKSRGTGFTYPMPRREAPPMITDGERKELRSLLDRRAKFHSIFVRSMLRAIKPYSRRADFIIEVASKPAYLERFAELVTTRGNARTLEIMLSEDRDIGQIILDIRKHMREECGPIPDSQLFSELPILLREYGRGRQIDEKIREKLFIKLFHEIAGLILQRASSAQIHEYLVKRDEELGGLAEILFEVIERTAASIAGSD
jgi:predicted RNA binding protein YcfA (HicA-like mRNA interferase family)